MHSLFPNWRLLWTYCWYRLTLASTLLLLAGFILGGPGGAENTDLNLLRSYLVSYGLIALIGTGLCHLKWPKLEWQLYGQLTLDIAALTFLMHITGGLSTGFGVLMIVVTATASILRPGNLPYFIAATASLLMLFEQVMASISPLSNVQFTTAGILGATCFLIAYAANGFTRRIAESDKSAKEHRDALKEMVELNNQLIDKIEAGLLFVDSCQQLVIINQAAKNWVGCKEHSTPEFRKLPLEIQSCYEGWLQSHQKLLTKEVTMLGTTLSVQVKNLDPKDENKGCIILLHDLKAQKQQAQQLKLASLGHLAANIAHEIRNPLSAMRQAAQLLSERKHLQEGERHLIEIITQHGSRLNQIIDNVNHLAKRQPSQLAQTDLKRLINEFVDEFKQQAEEAFECKILCQDEALIAKVDPSQLKQVMTNLTENGLRYSKKKQGKPSIDIILSKQDGVSYIEFHDQGQGISEADAPHLFEPFYTTESGGTGLGLYIAKELCELNHAHLECVADASGGIFRIQVTDNQNTGDKTT